MTRVERLRWSVSVTCFEETIGLMADEGLTRFLPPRSFDGLSGLVGDFDVLKKENTKNK